MRTRGKLLTGLLIFAALLLGGYTAALASGPSAGDQQYTDPLGSTTTTAPSTSSPPPATNPAPASSTPATSSTPAAQTSTPASTATTASSPTTSSDSPSSSSSSSSSGQSLPHTGLDVALAVALGIGLLATGLGLRRATRRV